MSDKAHDQTNAILFELEGRINRIYRTAERKTVEETDPLLDDMILDDEKATKAQREKHAKKNGLYEVVSIATGILLLANKAAIDRTNNNMPTIYNINYNGMASVFYNLTGISFARSAMKSPKTLLTRMDLRAIKEMFAQKHISNDIMRAVMKGIRKGEGAPQIAKRIRQVEQMSRNRSILIARTESTRTENNSRKDAFQAARSKGIKFKKKWKATNDSRTRDSHAAINGEVVELDKKFSNGLDRPGDPSGPASDVCNCRCVMIPELEEFD